MRLTQKLLLSSALTIFMTSQGWGSTTLCGVDDDGRPSKATTSSTPSMGPLGNFLSDFPGDKETNDFIGYFWETLSQTAKKVTQDFIAQPLTTIFRGSDDKLEAQRKAILGTLTKEPITDKSLSEKERDTLKAFESALNSFDVESAKAKIKVGTEIQKLLQDQSDLLKNYYLIPLETGDVDEETDLTQSLRKTVSGANVSPQRRAELELRKQFAVNNFKHLLEYGQNSIAVSRDMFVNLIQEAMTTKALLSKDVGTWANFKLDDMAEPFVFQTLPPETSSPAKGSKEGGASTSTPKVFEMLPIILADETIVKQPEEYRHPFVETSQIASSSAIKKADIEAEVAVVQIDVVDGGKIEHSFKKGFATYSPRNHKGMPAALKPKKSGLWRLFGY